MTNDPNIIMWGQQPFVVPEGFEKVAWADVKEGEDVYIIGTNNRKPWAYGPFLLHDANKFELKTPKGSTLIERSSYLLRKIAPPDDFRTVNITPEIHAAIVFCYNYVKANLDSIDDEMKRRNIDVNDLPSTFVNENEQKRDALEVLNQFLESLNA